MKLITSNAKTHSLVLNLILSILFLSLYACGSGGGSGGEGGGTGSLTFKLVLAVPESANAEEMTTMVEQPLECGESTGVEWIAARVSDKDGDVIAEPDPFPCEAGKATISEINAQNELTLDIEALNNDEDLILFTGSKTVDVLPGRITDAGLIELTSLNYPPQIDPIDSLTVQEGEAVDITITATDPNRIDALTFSADNLPPGANFDPDTQQFNWSPGYGYSGSYIVAFNVTDNGSPSMEDSAELSIEVTSAPWLFTTLDSLGTVGRYTSISKGYNDDNMHISYQYYDPNLRGDLKYATNSDGSWNISEVDEGGDGADVGINTSIVVDASNLVHISHFNTDSYSLRYSFGSSDGWLNTVLVPGNMTVQAGRYNSLDIDSAGNIHLSYNTSVFLAEGAIHLLFYQRTMNGNWTEAESVDDTGTAGLYNSVAANQADGRIHISYYDAGAEFLKAATRDLAGNWGSETVDNNPAVGIFSSIASDADGNSHISYYDLGQNALKYANNSSGLWTIQIVDNLTAEFEIGAASSIAVDVNGIPHIAYDNGSQLVYATNASGTWKTEVVDSTDNIGRYPAITLDSSDNIHISYYDWGTRDLKYARKATPEEDNLYPILEPIGDKTIVEGQLLEFVIRATDNNLSDSIALTAELNGDIGNLPTGAEFTDNLNGTATFSWTPGAEDQGIYQIRFVATDNGTPQLSDKEVVAITVNNPNQQPQFGSVGDQGIILGEPIVFQVTATDPDYEDVLTYSADLSSFPAGSNAVFDPLTRTFSWTPQFDDLRSTINDLTFRFGEYGGNLNLEINGDFRNEQNFVSFNGDTIGGTSVSVINGLGNDKGEVSITGPISSFSVGGQELWIDDLCFANTCVDFEDLQVGLRYSVGDDFSESGALIMAKSFFWSNGNETAAGFAEVATGSRGGGSGFDVNTNNINLDFIFDPVSEFVAEFTVTDNGTPPLSDTLQVRFLYPPPLM